MMSPQESRYARITVVIGGIGLIIAVLAWIHPFAPHSNVSGAGETATSSEPPAQPPGPQPDKPPADPPDPGKPSSEKVAVDSTSEGGSGAQPHTDRLNSATRSCGAPEIATLRPGAPAQVASGLAVLSIKTGREGSESYLTLGIVSDQDTLAEAVLGAPVRYRFATSRGAYFVNVTDVDLATGAMTVQVECEAKENKL